MQAFEKACFEGSPGALQGPIKTQFGYHLVRVGGAKESGAAQGAGSEQAVDSGTVEGKQEQSKNALKKQARAKGKRGK
jgi:parvulin-like peptidyl-prolyl isomerase